MTKLSRFDIDDMEKKDFTSYEHNLLDSYDVIVEIFKECFTFKTSKRTSPRELVTYLGRKLMDTHYICELAKKREIEISHDMKLLHNLCFDLIKRGCGELEVSFDELEKAVIEFIISESTDLFMLHDLIDKFVFLTKEKKDE